MTDNEAAHVWDLIEDPACRASDHQGRCGHRCQADVDPCAPQGRTHLYPGQCPGRFRPRNPGRRGCCFVVPAGNDLCHRLWLPRLRPRTAPRSGNCGAPLPRPGGTARTIRASGCSPSRRPMPNFGKAGQDRRLCQIAGSRSDRFQARCRGKPVGFPSERPCFNLQSRARLFPPPRPDVLNWDRWMGPSSKCRKVSRN